MADRFMTAHVGAKRVETRMNDTFAIKQSLEEGLRDFLTRFNEVRMTLPNVFEGMVVATEFKVDDDDLNGPSRWLTSVQSEPRNPQRDHHTKTEHRPLLSSGKIDPTKVQPHYQWSRPRGSRKFIGKQMYLGIKIPKIEYQTKLAKKIHSCFHISANSSMQR